MTVSRLPPIESLVTDFLQTGYVPAKDGKGRVEQALTLPLREQLVLLTVRQSQRRALPLVQDLGHLCRKVVLGRKGFDPFA
ncbi:hypothetical protein [Archangium lansingense]|uniref:Uncharacterized protein n=1 Tax=Archangium lansingense TaxID=2995310 RepID=A0ABT4APM9_9BACT|nr:hypothetical protein [Archangium lansinium]MCY1083655.1 hypothetical protein [Archangium lansinium]